MHKIRELPGLRKLCTFDSKEFDKVRSMHDLGLGDLT